MSNDKLYSSSDFELQAAQYRYAIVAARFNDHIVSKLLDGCVATLKTHGASDDQLQVVRVPGAFEIPLLCQRFAVNGKIDAVIALGCVIRGDTPHFDFVCTESSRGVLDVSLKYDIPVINGILTTDNTEQAEVRAQDYQNGGDNKGADAAKAAMEMLSILNLQAKS